MLGKAGGSEFLLQPSPGAALPGHSWLSPWGLGGTGVTWKIPLGGMLVGRVLPCGRDGGSGCFGQVPAQGWN